MNHTQPLFFPNKLTNELIKKNLNIYSPRKKKQNGIIKGKSRNSLRLPVTPYNMSLTLTNFRKSNNVLTKNCQMFLSQTNRNFPKGKVFHLCNGSFSKKSNNHKLNQKQILSLDLGNTMTIQRDRRYPIRRIDDEINKLLLKSKQVSTSPILTNHVMSRNESNQTESDDHYLTEYRRCIEQFEREPSHLVSILKKRKTKKGIVTNNKFIDSILNKIVRSSIFINTKNEDLTYEFVMNLLTNEFNMLKHSVDKIVQSNCNLKKFSRVINDYNNQNIFLPLINSIDPFIISTQVTERENIKRNHKFEPMMTQMNDYELKSKLKAINENKQYYKDGRIESKKNTDKEEKEKNEDVKSQSNKENEEEKNGILSYRKTYESIIKNSKTRKNSVLKQEDKLKETAIEKKIIKNKTTSSISLPDMSVSEELQNLLEIKSSLVVLTENVIKSSKVITKKEPIQLETNDTLLYNLVSSNKTNSRVITSGITDSTTQQMTASNFYTSSQLNFSTKRGVKTKTKTIIKNPENLKSISTIRAKKKQITFSNQFEPKSKNQSKWNTKKINSSSHKSSISNRKSSINEDLKSLRMASHHSTIKSIKAQNYQNEIHLALSIKGDNDNNQIGDLDLSSSFTLSDKSNQEENKDTIDEKPIIIIHREEEKKKSKKPETAEEEEQFINEIEKEFLGSIMEISDNNITPEKIDNLLQNAEVNEKINKLRKQLEETEVNKRICDISNKELLRMMLRRKNTLASNNFTESKTNITSIINQIGVEKKLKEEFVHRFNKRRLSTQRKSVSYFPSNRSHNVRLYFTKQATQPPVEFFDTFKSKVNEFNLNQEVKYQLTFQQSEESKAKFIEFLNKIEEMKKMDNDAYVKSLEENYNVYKEEIEGLIEARQAEERINKFVNCFATERKTISTKRKFYQDNLDLVDNEVDFSIVK